MEFVDLQEQRRRINDEIDAGIKRVLDHGRFILGPEVAELEEQLADFSGAKASDNMRFMMKFCRTIMPDGSIKNDACTGD